jgi:hypothetical protein
MSVGWGDTYGYYLPGQEIDVTGLAADDYWLTLDVDPADRLEETDETDNSAKTLLRLNPAAPSVVVLPDADGDGVTDAEDNCPAWADLAQTLPDWPVPPDDDDCDGFSQTAEQHVGTDPMKHCSDNSGVNNEPDAWPTDFNDNQGTNLADVTAFGPTFNKLPGEPGYNQRHDLNATNSVQLSDVVLLGAFFNKDCA